MIEDFFFYNQENFDPNENIFVAMFDRNSNNGSIYKYKPYYINYKISKIFIV